MWTIRSIVRAILFGLRIRPVILVCILALVPALWSVPLNMASLLAVPVVAVALVEIVVGSKHVYLAYATDNMLQLLCTAILYVITWDDHLHKTSENSR